MDEVSQSIIKGKRGTLRPAATHNSQGLGAGSMLQPPECLDRGSAFDGTVGGSNQSPHRSRIPFVWEPGNIAEGEGLQVPIVHLQRLHGIGITGPWATAIQDLVSHYRGRRYRWR
jgi:hypothetical protein